MKNQRFLDILKEKREALEQIRDQFPNSPQLSYMYTYGIELINIIESEYNTLYDN